MNKVVTLHAVPDMSIISEGFEKIDYCDTFQIVKSTTKNVDQVTTEVFRMMEIAKFLMKVRNSIVKVFGLDGVNEDEPQEAPYYPIGSRAVYFRVTDRNDNEIVMAEDDKHLNFRTSVLVERKEDVSHIYLTTIVHYNNFFGKFYFFFVKPFHRLLLKAQMKRLLQDN